MTRVVIVPGIGGSGETHWQTSWEATLPGAVRIRPSSWDEPRLADWLRAIDDVAPDTDTILVAHSMGCLAVATWLGANPGAVAGAFLVAPADPDGPAYPDAAREFGVAGAPLGVPALVVASTDDPYGSYAFAERAAQSWAAGIVSVGALGHVNADSGLGAWEDGAALFREFAGSLACAAVV